MQCGILQRDELASRIRVQSRQPIDPAQRIDIDHRHHHARRSAACVHSWKRLSLLVQKLNALEKLVRLRGGVGKRCLRHNQLITVSCTHAVERMCVCRPRNREDLNRCSTEPQRSASLAVAVERSRTGFDISRPIQEELQLGSKAKRIAFGNLRWVHSTVRQELYEFRWLTGNSALKRKLAAEIKR